MEKSPAPETPAAPPESASRGAFSPRLWMFLALFLLYPRSIGPVARFTRQKPECRPFLETVYAPLLILCRHNAPVEAFFSWYIGIWCPRPDM